MTRRMVYGVSFWLFIGATACTTAAIALPNWATYTAPNGPDPIRVSLGLHRRCVSLSGETTCTEFPQDENCYGENRYFCSMWRSAGFLMNLALILELACVVAYVVILAGGRAMREGGWKILVGLLALVALGQMIATVLVAYSHDRVRIGWVFDKSWILCTVSWTVMLLDGVGVTMAALLLPSEGDYELIPDPR